ncbi:hypothetical protein Tco_0385436 [Tanacetum coccineum]
MNILNDQPENELTNLSSRPVYTDAQTTFAELFEDTTDHQVSSAPATTTHNLITNPQQSSIQAKAKKLVTKARHTLLNFKKAVKKKFKEYDQKLEALSSINLHNILFDTMSLDQELLNAQDTEPSLRKRPHNDQDPPNNREGEKRRKKRKDRRESSSKSSKKDKSPMDFVQDGIPADKPQDKEEELI